MYVVISIKRELVRYLAQQEKSTRINTYEKKPKITPKPSCGHAAAVVATSLELNALWRE